MEYMQGLVILQKYEYSYDIVDKALLMKLRYDHRKLANLAGLLFFEFQLFLRC